MPAADDPPGAAGVDAAAAAVRAMVNQWVSLSTALAGRTLGGAAPPAAFDLQAVATQLLAAVNLPSRDEVLAVGRAVAALDARLARIEAALGPKAGTVRSPPPVNGRSTMVDLSQIKEHMNVIGADGVRVGTVDHVDGDRIKLTKTDSGDGRHHYISKGLIADVEGDDLRLSANAAVAVTFEEDE